MVPKTFQKKKKSSIIVSLYRFHNHNSQHQVEDEGEEDKWCFICIVFQKNITE